MEGRNFAWKLVLWPIHEWVQIPKLCPRGRVPACDWSWSSRPREIIYAGGRLKIDLVWLVDSSRLCLECRGWRHNSIQKCGQLRTGLQCGRQFPAWRSQELVWWLWHPWLAVGHEQPDQVASKHQKLLGIRGRKRNEARKPTQKCWLGLWCAIIFETSHFS